jgi:Rrf2 family protein
MLITRECDYAIRIIRALSSGEIISVQTICEQEQITSAMTYKITRKLEKAHIIKSYRGSMGVYALNCELNQLTLYDIFEVIDPKQLIIDCMQPDHKCSLNTTSIPCLVHREFCRIQNNLNQDLKEKTLAKILHG